MISNVSHELNVSHDLRTPLSALQGYLETLMMKEGQLTPQKQRNYLQVALRHSQRLAKRVWALFDLARLDAGEVQAFPEAFSLGELVQDVVQQYQLAARQKNQRLEAVFTADLPLVYADIALIERVLDNLLENVLRYTSEGGLITLSLAGQGDKIKVQMMDTGTGIRPEDLPRVFERFYRAASQPETQGSVGLAIAKRILELHGSAIEAKSVLGSGTVFAFHLAVYLAPSAE